MAKRGLVSADDVLARGERDRVLLKRLLEDGDLSDAERDAFSDMKGSLESKRELSAKQRAWVEGVFEREGLSEGNLFSRLSPEEQARQREAASKIKLPWER